MSIFKKVFREVSTSQEKEIKIKYEKAITIPNKPLMTRGGTYKKGFPEGIIVHFTGGHSEQRGEDGVAFGTSQGHRYLFMDAKGQIYQQFCLSGYGAHAGQSKCPKTGRTTVSQFYVGLEIACEGKLSKDSITDWGKRIPKERTRAGFIDNKWQKSAGVFETFEAAQEESLLEFCVWACKKFGFDETTIFGHDEVAPDRKNDPGLSLSVSMDEFRNKVKQRLAPEQSLAA